MFQIENHDKTSGKKRNETEITYLPNKEFKVMAIKMLSEHWRRMDKHSENFSKEVESIRKYQIQITELKNAITELKNILGGV